MKTRTLLLLILSLFFSATNIRAQPDSCCNDMACRAQARDYVVRLTSYLTMLGPFEEDDTLREIFLKTFEKSHRTEYKDLRKLVTDCQRWKDVSQSRRNCFSALMADAGCTDCLWWLDALLKKTYSRGLRSPEFVQGIGSHLNIAQGAFSPFSHSAQYALMAEAYLSYTFTGKAKDTLLARTKKGYYKAGGRLRLMLGPGLLYSGHTTYLLVQPRAEIRLKDVGSDKGTIGCSKLILQGRFNDQFQMAGTGLAFEVAYFNLQLTADYDFASQHWLFMTGIGGRLYHHDKKQNQ